MRFSFRLLFNAIGRALLLNLALSAAPSANAASVPPEDVLKAFDASQRARETNISGYTANEHYIIRRNGGEEIAAELTAESTYIRGKGKDYKVLSRTGSAFMQSQVLDRVLDREKELYQPQNRPKALLTADNYNMRLLPNRETVDQRDCFVIELAPKTKSPYLIDGKAWVDSANATLVRMQGIVSASTGLVTGRPEVRRDFEVFDGYAMTKRSDVKSKTLLAGATEIIIEYSGYKVQH